MCCAWCLACSVVSWKPQPDRSSAGAWEGAQAAGVLGMLCACACAGALRARSERPGWRRGGAPLLWQPRPRRRGSRCWGLPRLHPCPSSERGGEQKCAGRPCDPSRRGLLRQEGAEGGEGVRCGAGATPRRPQERRLGAGTLPPARVRTPARAQSSFCHLSPPRSRHPEMAASAGAPLVSDDAGARLRARGRSALRPGAPAAGRDACVAGFRTRLRGWRGDPTRGQPCSSASSEGNPRLSSTVNRLRSGGGAEAPAQARAKVRSPRGEGAAVRVSAQRAVRRPVRPEPLAPSP